MTTAYPKLKDEKVFELIKDVLGLEVIFSPDVEDDKTKREYEVYSYYDGSIGKELIELFKTIWDAFESNYSGRTLEIVFPEIPNFKNEFYEMAIKSLSNIGWKLLDYIVVVGQVEYGRAEYKINGIVVSECHLKYTEKYYLSNKTYTRRHHFSTKKINKSLFEFLDDISPVLFLLDGLSYNINLNQNYINIFWGKYF